MPTYAPAASPATIGTTARDCRVWRTTRRRRTVLTTAATSSAAGVSPATDRALASTESASSSESSRTTTHLLGGHLLRRHRDERALVDRRPEGGAERRDPVGRVPLDRALAEAQERRGVPHGQVLDVPQHDARPFLRGQSRERRLDL